MGSGLSHLKAWIFDLDGTLTVPMHDFAGFKQRMGLPPHLDILSGIAQMPVDSQQALHEAVVMWEQSLINDAVAAPGAVPLLAAILGRKKGVVTRNTKESALRTLRAIGLDEHFREEDVFGRECAPPKPAPDALERLLASWGMSPEQAIMIGDFRDDILAGKSAGTRTALVRGPDAWGADHCVASLNDLIPLLQTSSS